MKKSTSFLMGMAALLLSFGLVLSGCDDGTASSFEDNLQENEKINAMVPTISVQPQDASYTTGETTVTLLSVKRVCDGRGDTLLSVVHQHSEQHRWGNSG